MLTLNYFLDGDDLEEKFHTMDKLVTRVADLIDHQVVYMWNDDKDSLYGRLDVRHLPHNLFQIEDNGELLINRSLLLQNLGLFDQLWDIHDVMWDTTSSYWGVTKISGI